MEYALLPILIGAGGALAAPADRQGHARANNSAGKYALEVECDRSYSIHTMKRSALKNTPAVRAAICKLIALGLSPNRAAGKVKVHHSTVAEWRKNDPQFDADVQNAEAAFIQKQIENVQAAANKGSWQASAWLLERKFPSEFSQPQVQLHQGVVKVEFNDLGETLKRLRQSSEGRRFLSEMPSIIEVESSPPRMMNGSGDHAVNAG